MRICSKKDIRIITGVMAASLIFSGCSVSLKKDKPLKENPNVKTEINLDKVAETQYDRNLMEKEYRRFSLDLLNQTIKDADGEGNVMVSPASVMMALDMVAAGAKGDTLKQLTDVFAKGQGALDQQAYAAALMDKINGSKDVEFTCANAVWNNEKLLGDGINTRYVDYIKETFLAEYKAEAFGNGTADEINKWSDEHTKHMISEIVKDIDPYTAMILVNAICFDGKWETEYEDYQVNTGKFTKTDGSTQDVMFLSDETRDYFETDKATGFMKAYKGGEYAFLAILPKDGSISANAFAKDFTAEDYEKFIKSASTEWDVYSKMPEFKSDFELTMNDTLKTLGAGDVFDENKADLSGIAGEPGDLFVSKVIHKTHIEVDRTGTKAAAVSAVSVEVASAEPPEFKTVNCDRPFVYAIVDVKTMTPIFIGTVNEV
ncbi:MAG: serpin family protein [Saccharofermentans sp.]|nr:serpin family protein [Saccharofermentans sp.]